MISKVISFEDSEGINARLSNKARQIYSHTHTHLEDAVVCSFRIHDSSMSGEGPDPQGEFHQLLVLILHQKVLHIAAAAERQGVAI